MEEIIEKDNSGHRQLGLFCGKSYPVESLDSVGRVVEASASGAFTPLTFEQSGTPLLERIGYHPETGANQNPERAYTQ